MKRYNAQSKAMKIKRGNLFEMWNKTTERIEYFRKATSSGRLIPCYSNGTGVIPGQSYRSYKGLVMAGYIRMENFTKEMLEANKEKIQEARQVMDSPGKTGKTWFNKGMNYVKNLFNSQKN